MKKVYLLVLEALVLTFLPACNQEPGSPVPEFARPKATPVPDAPKTIPIPIQPFTSAPATAEMPHTTPIPVPLSTPVETGTAAEPIPTPSPTATPSELPALSGTDSPSPAVTGS